MVGVNYTGPFVLTTTCLNGRRKCRARRMVYWYNEHGGSAYASSALMYLSISCPSYCVPNYLVFLQVAGHPLLALVIL